MDNNRGAVNQDDGNTCLWIKFLNILHFFYSVLFDSVSTILLCIGDDSDSYHDISGEEDDTSSSHNVSDVEEELEENNIADIRIPEQDDPQDLISDHSVSVLNSKFWILYFL